MMKKKVEEFTFKRRVQWRLMRLQVLWRNWTRSLDKSITLERRKLTAYEEKGIRLWKLCLRDEDTQMAYNSHGVRQIEKEHLFIMFQPNGSNYIMTVMDVSDSSRCLYEFHIPGNEATPVCEYFDFEMERRMLKVENNKRSIIENDIDKLIEREEKIKSN